MAWRVSLPSALDEVQSRQTRPPLVTNKLPWLLPHKGRMPGPEPGITTDYDRDLGAVYRAGLKGSSSVVKATPRSTLSVSVTSRSQILKRDSFPCPAQRQGRHGWSPVELFVSWIEYPRGVFFFKTLPHTGGREVKRTVKSSRYGTRLEKPGGKSTFCV